MAVYSWIFCINGETRVTYLQLLNRISRILNKSRTQSPRGPLEGVGPEIETFLGPEMAKSEASAIWAQKSHLRLRLDLQRKTERGKGGAIMAVLANCQVRWSKRRLV